MGIELNPYLSSCALPPKPRDNETVVGVTTVPRSVTPTRTTRLRDVCVVVALVLVATLPFLDKAFHIDDVYYLQIARHILEDPLRPYSFTYIAEGRGVDVFENDWSPPLFKYVLALGILAFGESEPGLHGVMGLFVACAAGSMYALSLRFSPHPLLATALFVLNPLFLPSANLMLDVPMLALGLAGLACHVWGTDRGSLRLVLLGGLLGGLAVVTKYPAFILFPLFALYSMMRRSWLGFTAQAVALLPVALWSVQNLLVHGAVHFVHPMFGGPGISWLEHGRRVLATVTILGSALFPLCIIPHSNLSRQRREIILVVCLVLGMVCEGLRADRPWIQIGEHFVFFTGGLYLLLASTIGGVDVWRCVGESARLDVVFLVVWLLLGWLVSIESQFIAVRHVLWALPAAALVVTRVVVSVGARLVWRIMLGAVVSGIGLSVGYADMELANMFRQQVYALQRTYGTLQLPVYYLGEDGFAYYAAASGWQPLQTGVALSDSRAVIICSSATAWSIPEVAQRYSVQKDLIREIGRFPVTTMAPGVNFYRTGTSDLPWEFGRTTQIYFDAYWYAAPAGEGS